MCLLICLSWGFTFLIKDKLKMFKSKIENWFREPNLDLRVITIKLYIEEPTKKAHIALW